jgi:N-methylhydantoinase A
MGFNINIDVGGTFTDFYAAGNGSGTQLTKTPTTHYDLSVGFMKGMGELARLYGMRLSDLFARTDAVHYCTTLGTNALLERTGPKLGFITTAGHEDAIYIGRGRSWADGGSPQQNRDLARISKPQPLISRDMVVGVRERVDSFGRVLAPLSRDEVLEMLQILVDRGAMGFVVCLLWSFQNPTHEQMIKRIIEEEYPEDYLGSMPVTLSSEVSPKSGEYTRFTTTIVNAYIQGVMGEEINRLVTELRDGGYRKPLVLAHNTGGMKKASRTRAVLTHNAGPVAGLHGAATLGRLCGYDNVVFTDMGGTSFDIGVVSGGLLKTYDFIPVIDRWRTNIAAIEVKSIGAGGGSIAWINTLMGDILEVGPKSAGSQPGPACYDKGGTEPTVTDADLVLGYLNPDNYLGGKMMLDPDLAWQAIEQKVAKPLGLDVPEAAMRIRRLVDAKMGQEVFNEVALKGYDPRDFVLLACGGAGPTHACGFAPYLGVSRVLASTYSPVFGAFGASTMNIQQVWDRSRTLKIFRWVDQSYMDDLDAFNSVVEELRDLALRDLRLEGYTDDKVNLRLELDMRYGMQYNLTRIVSPHLTVSKPEDFKDICDQFTADYSATYSPEAVFPLGGINVECFYLTAWVETPTPDIPTEAPGGAEPPEGARLGTREAWWGEPVAVVDTPIYSFEGLRAGNVVIGPAIVEAKDTTYVVEPGWSLTIDRFHNASLTAGGEQ